MKKQTYVELEFLPNSRFYKIRKITSAIFIPRGGCGKTQVSECRIGDNLNESEAKELAANPNYKVTVK